MKMESDLCVPLLCGLITNKGAVQNKLKVERGLSAVSRATRRSGRQNAGEIEREGREERRENKGERREQIREEKVIREVPDGRDRPHAHSWPLGTRS
jgi:hypothetical protein